MFRPCPGASASSRDDQPTEQAQDRAAQALLREDGQWRLFDARSPWQENETNGTFVAFSWTGPGDLRRLVAVNYAGHQSQCYLRLPWGDPSGRTWRFADRLGAAVYDRDGADPSAHGLYLDLPALGLPRLRGAAGLGRCA